MKVNGSNYSQYVRQSYKNNKNINKGDSSVQQSSKDRIEISSAGRDIQQAGDVNREEKIERIKASIAGGTYKVSPEKLANGIMEKINREKFFEGETK